MRSAESILQGTGCPVFITDENELIVALNKPAAELLERRPEEVRGKPCHSILAGQDPFGNAFCHKNCAVTTMARDGEPVRCFEMGIRTGAGTRIDASVAVLVLRGAHTGDLRVIHFLTPLPNKRSIGAPTPGSHAQRAPGAAGSRTTGPLDGSGTGDRPSLSPRETEVLLLLARGQSSQDIADLLCISVLTVRNHTRNILQKMGVHSQLEAVALAYRDGLV
jgi:DNA-binding CsgD family transcriptional regulator